MKVERHDHLLRFSVTSETRGAEITHLVDLGAFKGHGRCSCEHFEFRILPELDAGRIAGWCKHIIECRSQLADEVIRHSLATNPSPTE